jgi:hypothetical protein
LRSTRLPGRAGSLRQVVGQRVQTWLAGLWSALEEAGQRRAAPHLLSQARRLEADNPALANALRALAQPNDKPFVPAATAAGTH